MIPNTLYVAASSAGLSTRATEFIRARSHRARFDRGITGERLRDEIARVYGRPNDAIVDLLDALQSRYGGLTYESGFFQTVVRFAPVCEPEDALEELEILYAVVTGGPAGASVKANGGVEVGLDAAGVVEFASLDSLIECDALFATVEALGATTERYLDSESFETVLGSLVADERLALRPVSEASGRRTHWLESESLMVYATNVWSALGLVMPPMIRAWAIDEDEIDRVDSLLGSTP
ncbi:hypothetical protein [Phytohabitans houttuyneae]|uniref:Uncharacterized protein n=1 Tax=Phytohabitans houttuyneae TaxID=1076126 RepID=A0A6V8KMC3_9ACTN|nr:hypothetical protein [Phytohabitans houttuyneae]GFJ86322.1 hypothetical protein Phou_105020 [Phytohabitans houttuyneae]